MNYPAIPEGCNCFLDGLFFRTQRGFILIDFLINSIWVKNDRVRPYSCFEINTFKVEMRDLCNAARCAWLDEAEKEFPNRSSEIYRFHKTSPRLREYVEFAGKNIDYTHCLAWAEAWARELKGE